MNILFELSKEHPTLPGNEIVSCLNAEHISFQIIEANSDVLVISSDADVDVIKNVARRISHAFYVNEFFFISSNSNSEIEKNAKMYTMKFSGSIAIRSTNKSKHMSSQMIIDSLGNVYTKNNEVDLKNPDNEIRVYITDSEVYVGKKIMAIDRTQYEKRKGQFRPFFSPISMHPKVARALVNLSEISTGQIIYDPFCGTGGILIEAGLIGANVIGSDASAKMIHGTRQNLSFYGIQPTQLFTADIGDIDSLLEKKVDAVVTDLPYGRATSTMGESRDSLYPRAFEHIAKVLRPKARAVIGLPSKETIIIAQRYLSLQTYYDIRVHSSLTRYFAVLEKEP